MQADRPLTPLLEVDDLTAYFFLRRRTVRAVDGVSFSVGGGEIVGLVGESGSGKSATTLSILRLLPAPGRIVKGDVRFRGESLLAMSQAQLRNVRGHWISLIVQDALASLNPVTTVGEQVSEVVLAHEPTTRSSASARALDMFRLVSMPEPTRRLRRYPHELSGGMQQRTIIAAGLVMTPKLIIADEPTTALDVTIQAQILRLLRDIRDRIGSAILYVTHDLATVAEICDRVLVMYAGEIVEAGAVRRVFAGPRHPYTRGLMASVPPLGEPPAQLPVIPGVPPDATAWPPGCRFAARCDLRQRLGSPEICTTVRPTMPQADHAAACHFAGHPLWTAGGPETHA